MTALQQQFPTVFHIGPAATSSAPSHGIQHTIETVGQPVKAKFRHLVQQAAAKKEF